MYNRSASRPVPPLARRQRPRIRKAKEHIMRSRAILRSILVMLITCFPFLLAIAQSGNPHIASVTQVWARPNQTIQIAGSGFGSTRPYDGDSGFIRIVDLTQKWGAGRTGDAV